jgi:guanylate kinase
MNFSANLFIISSPSGAGKSTLVNRLFRDLGAVHPMKFSVSHTTRGMRPGETDGVEYHFTDIPTFQKMIEGNEFLEWAKVFDNYYGTSRKTVEDSLRAGTDVFLDIDWQGARQIKKQFPTVRTVFILPPSIAVLKERLEKRGQDSAEVIRSRMEKARSEIIHYDEYDYVIVNDVLDEAYDQLRSVVIAEQSRLELQKVRYASLLADLT